MDAEYFDKMKPRFLKPPSEKTHFEGDPFPAVPTELKSLRQWVVWLYHSKVGDVKPSKMLYQPSGWAASTSDPRTWTTYSLAVACYQKHTAGQRFEYRYRPNKNASYQVLTCDLAGIGYVFSAKDPFCGIDLDNCLENGNVKPWAVPVVEKFKTIAYGEVSPSGNGIKFWTRATWPEMKHKVYIDETNDEAIEAYDSGRYFTVTGRGGKGEIRDGQAVIDWLVSEYMTPDPKPQQTTPVPATQRTHPKSHLTSADEVIDRIRQSRQAHKFDGLMRGNMTGYGSQSEADIALCSVIAFWSQDAGVIDAIFRQSQLYRDKWDETHRADGATYGEMTIEKALSAPRETYTSQREISETRRRRRKPRETRRKK